MSLQISVCCYHLESIIIGRQSIYCCSELQISCILQQFRAIFSADEFIINNSYHKVRDIESYLKQIRWAWD